ncbi:MAG: hypothetical protein OHK0052_24630 [Anaerolineales bacterium]
MFKKLYAFVALLVLDSMILTACTTAAPSAGGEADCSKPEVFCVGLVTDVGEVDDKSFNQSAWEGVQRAKKELGAQVKYVETKDAKDYMANMQGERI